MEASDDQGRGRRPGRRPGRLAASLVVLSILAGGAAASQESAGDSEEAVARGRVSYRLHCAGCHGEKGGGDGPMAAELEVPATDLTRLTAKSGGRFPTTEVYRAIDGRDRIPAHGPPQMPSWGFGLRDLGRDHDQEAEVRSQIRDLVGFLETLQRTPGEDSHPDG